MAKLLSYFRARIAILQGLLILSVGLWIYSPVFRGAWLWDDATEIFQNPVTLDPNGWWANWFEPARLTFYYPIKADVQWVQWRLWGPDTTGYHLTNIGLHLCSALLIWRMLSKFGLRLACLGGLLFVVHPVTVESVAWIAELKNTLSLPPFLLAMCSWIDYDEHHRPRDYILTAGWFLIAMLCKITMAFFPAIILLYAWWKHGRIGWRDLKISAPFWIMAIALASITICVQHVKSVNNHYLNPLGGLWPRLVCTEETILFFIGKAVWPVVMLPLYQPWRPASASIWELLPGLILIGALIWSWTRRKTWGRHVLLGAGFFLINLIPVIGFIQLQYSSMTWSLDHLNYLPLIGLIGLAVAGLEQISRRLSTMPRRLFFGFVTVLMAVLAVGSCLYASVFVSPFQLWIYTVANDPKSSRAHTNLGYVLLDQHQMTAAVGEFSTALKINPEDSDAFTGVGNALFYSGHANKSLPYFEAALKLNPNSTFTYNALANAQMQTSDLDKAKATCEQALRIDPDNVNLHCTLTLVLAKMGNHSAAMAEFETARRLEPANSKTLDALKVFLLDPAQTSK